MKETTREAGHEIVPWRQRSGGQHAGRARQSLGFSEFVSLISTHSAPTPTLVLGPGTSGPPEHHTPAPSPSTPSAAAISGAGEVIASLRRCQRSSAARQASRCQLSPEVGERGNRRHFGRGALTRHDGSADAAPQPTAETPCAPVVERFQQDASRLSIPSSILAPRLLFFSPRLLRLSLLALSSTRALRPADNKTTGE